VRAGAARGCMSAGAQLATEFAQARFRTNGRPLTLKQPSTRVVACSSYLHACPAVTHASLQRRLEILFGTFYVVVHPLYNSSYTQSSSQMSIDDVIDVAADVRVHDTKIVYENMVPYVRTRTTFALMEKILHRHGPKQKQPRRRSSYLQPPRIVSFCFCFIVCLCCAAWLSLPPSSDPPHRARNIIMDEWMIRIGFFSAVLTSSRPNIRTVGFGTTIC
jgi:hypothetical protein